MKTLVTVALTVIIVQLFPIECKHPQYSFQCLENGDIHLFGLHENSELLEHGRCSVNTSGTGQNYHNILYNCQPSEEGISVNITVYDPDIDGSTETPTTTLTTSPTTAATLIGGHGSHSFTVTCENIPQQGIDKTVVHVFEGNEFNVLPVNNMEVDGVEMRFKADNNINSPDINAIYVGDEFFMFLEYKGTKDYHLVPKKCKAYSGTSLGPGRQPEVDLWDRVGADCSPNDELLKDFKIVSSKLIYAEMFGFRFSDSEYITIQCEVGILPSSPEQLPCNRPTHSSSTSLSSSSSPSLSSSSPPSSSSISTKVKRRRRGIENVEVKTKFAASKIRVYDNKDVYQMENKSPQKSFDISVWIVLVIGTLLYRW